MNDNLSINSVNPEDVDFKASTGGASAGIAEGILRPNGRSILSKRNLKQLRAGKSLSSLTTPGGKRALSPSTIRSIHSQRKRAAFFTRKGESASTKPKPRSKK